MNVKVISFGELMLRLAPPGNQRFIQAQSFDVNYGGSEANVAVSLSGFGINSELITRLPQNSIGQSAICALKMHGVGCENIIWGGDRLGLYFVEKGAMNRPSKVLYDRQHSSFSEIQPGLLDWNHLLDGSSWFHWSGITPAISQGTAMVCQEAIGIAKKKGITISCDLNFRSALWKYGKNASDVMSELLKECDLIISNEEEIDKYFGIKAEKNNIIRGEIDQLAYEMIAKQLKHRFPKVKLIAFSLRSSKSADDNFWSGVMWDGNRLHKSPSYRMSNIVDRIGAGDSFAAGLIYGFLKYPNDHQQILNFAIAASSLKHTIQGDFNLSSVEEVITVMQGDSSGRIQR